MTIMMMMIMLMMMIVVDVVLDWFRVCDGSPWGSQTAIIYIISLKTVLIYSLFKDSRCTLLEDNLYSLFKDSRCNLFEDSLFCLLRDANVDSSNGGDPALPPSPTSKKTHAVAEIPPLPQSSEIL